MKIKSFTVGPFQENTYVISDPKTKQAYVYDPGGWSENALKYIKDNQLRVLAIISSHGHIDHIAGAYDMRKATEAPFHMNTRDSYLLEGLDQISAYFNFPKVPTPVVDASIEEGAVYELGDERIEVIETPGHTPGGICLKIGNHLFSGDTLFQGSIGRTDLPGGDTEQLLESIQKKLMTLDSDIVVHCGHGSDTTIGQERQSNPHLQKKTSNFI